ncbi:MAG: ABC transporter ATP-binding protein [Desulfovibrio sp.]|jgi:lipoprotein-releasing system ATP-binding protein|nr:ABC transporter ATP-binding protein [Desulfovibrio sp.]
MDLFSALPKAARHVSVKGREPLYALRGLSKHYPGPGEQVNILREISLDIEEGESVAIMGASGSGKSTLLHILGTLASPSAGEVRFCGNDLGTLTSTAKAVLRNKEIGFVFQFHHLLPEFSAVENVAMPALIAGESRQEARTRAGDVLAQVGLEERADFNVTLLSGGERQRAAIARAIVQKPRLLLADEPTGNLDEKNGYQIADLLMELNAGHRMSMVVVTHNPGLAARMSRCFELKSGALYEQKR